MTIRQATRRIPLQPFVPSTTTPLTCQKPKARPRPRRRLTIDVIHADRLQDLSLDKVSDPDLGHDGQGDGVDDVLDHGRVGLFVFAKQSGASVRCLWGGQAG